MARLGRGSEDFRIVKDRISTRLAGIQGFLQGQGRQFSGLAAVKTVQAVEDPGQFIKVIAGRRGLLHLPVKQFGFLIVVFPFKSVPPVFEMPAADIKHFPVYEDLIFIHPDNVGCRQADRLQLPGVPVFPAVADLDIPLADIGKYHGQQGNAPEYEKEKTDIFFPVQCRISSSFSPGCQWGTWISDRSLQPGPSP